MYAVIVFHRICADALWPADLLHVIAVFLTAGLFISVLFAAQLFLIHQIEKAHLSRSSTGGTAEHESNSRARQ